MESTPIRCLCCGVTFTHHDIYLHPAHRCVHPIRTTAPPAARDAVVLPFRARKR